MQSLYESICFFKASEFFFFVCTLLKTIMNKQYHVHEGVQVKTEKMQIISGGIAGWMSQL